MATGESKPKFDFDLFTSNVKDQVPEEQKKGQFGKLVSYALDTLKSGCSIMKVFDGVQSLNKMKTHIGKVETLLDKLIKTSDSKEEIFKEAQEFHARNCTGVMDNFDFGPHIELTRLDGADGLSEGEKIKSQILTALKDQHRQASDEIIMTMAKANAVAATVQLIKLYYAWKTISAASNVIEDKKKFDLINKNLQRMETMVNELVELCETQPEDKSIDRRTTKINLLFTSTLSKISDVTVNINGHIQRLELVSDYAFVDGVSSSVTAVSQGIQVWSAFDNLSSLTQLIGMLSVAMHGIFGFASAAVFMMSQDKLKELRKDLKEANYLRETLEDLRQQAEDAVMLS